MPIQYLYLNPGLEGYVTAINLQSSKRNPSTTLFSFIESFSSSSHRGSPYYKCQRVTIQWRLLNSIQAIEGTTRRKPKAQPQQAPCRPPTDPRPYRNSIQNYERSSLSFFPGICLPGIFLCSVAAGIALSFRPKHYSNAHLFTIRSSLSTPPNAISGHRSIRLSLQSLLVALKSPVQSLYSTQLKGYNRITINLQTRNTYTHLKYYTYTQGQGRRAEKKRREG